MFQIFAELKRRNVVRVAAAYVLVSWIIIQLTALAVPALHLPQWVNSFIFITLAAGLFIALVVAWAFEVTPEGVRRTIELDQYRATSQHPVRPSDWIMIAALVVVVGFFTFDRIRGPVMLSATPSLVASSASIAVLPFRNLSAEPGQQGLSQAFTEDILNQLTKMSGLRVASRAASFQFGDRETDVREIGAALSVATVIEGSVQKVGERLRINAQLIDVNGGHNLWSESFDRDAIDLLSVQDEVSRAIVAAVSPYLLDENALSAQGGEAVPDGDPASLYQTGLSELDRRTEKSINAAVAYFEKAIAGDPRYADAYAAIGVARLLLADQNGAYGGMAISEAVASARPFIEKSLVLDTGSSVAYAAKGLLELSLGNLSSARDALKRSISLNPKSASAQQWMYLTYVASGRRAAGIHHLEAAIAAAPNSLPVVLNESRLLALQNNRRAAKQALAPVFEAYPGNSAVTAAWAALQIDDGNRQDAIKLLKRSIDSTGDARTKFYLGLNYLDLGAFDEAGRWLTDRQDWLFLAQGEPQRALISARQRYQHHPSDIDAIYSLAEAEAAAGNFDVVVAMLESIVGGTDDKKFGPGRGPLLDPLITLAVAKKATGAQEDAVRLLERVSEKLKRKSEMNLDNPQLDYLSAGIQAQLGNSSQALASLSRALARDFPGRWIVFWDPVFADIRESEEFQSLLVRLRSEQVRDRKNLGIDG